MKLTKKLLWMSLIMVLLVSITMVNVTSASPDTQFYVDPSFIDGTPEGKFSIEINVVDAPPSYAWEFSLSWDPDLLELGFIMEGGFLHRGYMYPTTGLAYDGMELDEANFKGEIKVGCSLTGEVPWASGAGLLCRLGFDVQAEDGCDLNLFDTRLFDWIWEGSPAPTDYPNVDGFVVTSPPFCSADLYEWKLKVNRAAGIGKGHKSTVGEPNLLEAYAINTGPVEVYVQARFEILDSAGDMVATVKSDIGGPLLPEESTIVSAYWTAYEADIYDITANLYYSMWDFAPTIQDGFSRTQTLRVDMPPK